MVSVVSEDRFWTVYINLSALRTLRLTKNLFHGSASAIFLAWVSKYLVSGSRISSSGGSIIRTAATALAIGRSIAVAAACAAVAAACCYSHVWGTAAATPDTTEAMETVATAAPGGGSNKLYKPEALSPTYDSKLAWAAAQRCAHTV